MACLTNLTGSQLLGCGAPPTAPLGRPIGAKLIRADYVQSYAVNTSGYLNAAAVTLASGAPVPIEIETGNGAVVVSMGMKGGEVYPQAFDPTIELTFFGIAGSPISSTQGAALQGGANLPCVIAVNHGNGAYRIYGLGYPLECLSIEGDTNGNGFCRVTYGVEDWQTGTTVYSMKAADYEALSKPVEGVTPSIGDGDGPVPDENPLG